jgi:hypothetical protein
MRTRSLLAAAALAAAIPALPAEARPEAPTELSRRSGPIARYQARLEQDAFRVFAPEVTGDVRAVLAERSVELWAALTIYEWQGMLLRFVPPLEKAARVVVRRSEVLWSEERIDDPYASGVFQQATVHAVQEGIDRVLASMERPGRRPAADAGEALAGRTPARVAVPRAAAGAPAPVAPSGNARRRLAPPVAHPAPPAGPRLAPPARGTPVPARSPTPTQAPAAATTPGATTRSVLPAPPAAPAPAASLAPARLHDYRAALDREAFRVLVPEIERGMQDALAARKGAMRAAPTVVAWQAMLVEVSPTLRAAGRVLERRTEVVREQARVADPYESAAAQRAAVEGLQSGLERVLAQFGR